MSIINVTAADCQVYLEVKDYLPLPIRIQGFAEGSAITTSPRVVTVSRRGVDGRAAFGVVKKMIETTMSLEANCPSANTLRDIANSMDENNTPYDMILTVKVPAEHLIYTFTNGSLSDGGYMPDVKETLQPRDWKFSFAKMNFVKVD